MLTRMPCAGEFDRRGLRDTFHGMLAADIYRRGRAADVIGMEVRDQGLQELPASYPNASRALCIIC
jgi:hypothetical protein